MLEQDTTGTDGLITCVFCLQRYEPNVVYWKGVSFRQNGTPLRALAVCPDCLVRVEVEASGATDYVYRGREVYLDKLTKEARG